MMSQRTLVNWFTSDKQAKSVDLEQHLLTKHPVKDDSDSKENKPPCHVIAGTSSKTVATKKFRFVRTQSSGVDTESTHPCQEVKSTETTCLSHDNIPGLCKIVKGTSIDTIGQNTALWQKDKKESTSDQVEYSVTGRSTSLQESVQGDCIHQGEMTCGFLQTKALSCARLASLDRDCVDEDRELSSHSGGEHDEPIVGNTNVSKSSVTNPMMFGPFVVKRTVAHDDCTVPDTRETDKVPDRKLAQTDGNLHKAQPVSVLLESLGIPHAPVVISPRMKLSGREAKVYFDLETAGLGVGVDILQISALCGGHTFDRYVTPTGRIQRGASSVTGIRCRRGVMKVRGKRVHSVPIAAALRQFITWLSPFNQCILVAHNAKFDSQHILHHVMALNLQQAFEKTVVGFVDTLPMFKRHYPHLPDYKQTTLAAEILNTSYAAHNASADVRTLKRLVETVRLTESDLAGHGQSVQAAIRNITLKKVTDVNLQTLTPLTAGSFLSVSMATKIAQSSLNLDHLDQLYRRGGVELLYDVLSAQGQDGTTRVTKSRKIIDKLCQYFTDAK